jgi:hypothetical protein
MRREMEGEGRSSLTLGIDGVLRARELGLWVVVDYAACLSVLYGGCTCMGCEERIVPPWMGS